MPAKQKVELINTKELDIIAVQAKEKRHLGQVPASCAHLEDILGEVLCAHTGPNAQSQSGLSLTNITALTLDSAV